MLFSIIVSVLEGEDVDFYCDVRGNFKFLVSWIRKGGMFLFLFFSFCFWFVWGFFMSLMFFIDM